MSDVLAELLLCGPEKGITYINRGSPWPGQRNPWPGKEVVVTEVGSYTIKYGERAGQQVSMVESVIVDEPDSTPPIILEACEFDRAFTRKDGAA